MERIELTSFGGTKASLIGVIPKSVASSADERGIPEKREIAKVHRAEGRMSNAGEPAYIIDWLANVAGHSFHWPDQVRTEIKTSTKRTLGSDNDAVVVEDMRETSSFGSAAVKLTVCGTTFYLCDNGSKSEALRSGYILYVGTPDDEFRKRIRNCLSFALGAYLVHLGSTTFTQDWKLVEFSSLSAYSMDQKAFRIVCLSPAPLHPNQIFGVDRDILSRAVNGVFQAYDMLKFGDLSWAYWHAQAATPHIAGVHFGAAIEALLRRYAGAYPNAVPTKPITDRATWKAFHRHVSEEISGLQICETSKALLRSNLGSFNRYPLKAILESVAGHLGIRLGESELLAWKRRDDAAHGNEIEPGGELELIRDNKLLCILFNRLILRMTNASDRYQDYFTLGHLIRGLEEPPC